MEYKIEITAKFLASRRLRFEDTKRIMSPEKFRDFRETGPMTHWATKRKKKFLLYPLYEKYLFDVCRKWFAGFSVKHLPAAIQQCTPFSMKLMMKMVWWRYLANTLTEKKQLITWDMWRIPWAVDSTGIGVEVCLNPFGSFSVFQFHFILLCRWKPKSRSS